MIWALMILLGIPLWLVAGAAGGALLSRRNAKRKPGVFPVRLRPVEVGAGGKWSRKQYARWVQRVLLSNKGAFLNLTDAYPVASGVRTNDPDSAKCKGLGERVVAVTITTDDGMSLEIATSAEFTELLFAPFDSRASAAGP